MSINLNTLAGGISRYLYLKSYFWFQINESSASLGFRLMTPKPFINMHLNLLNPFEVVRQESASP